MKNRIEDIIKENIETSSKLLDRSIENIEKISNTIIDVFRNKKKLLIFGNGGSAADAQHIAAEFINKFKFDRDPMPAIALTTDTSIISSISNDSSFSHVFEKQIKALGNEGDIALAITTSDTSFEENGHSSNIALALKVAKEKGMKTIGFVGERSEDILNLLDHYIMVPSKETPRIQETQILIAHIICEIVESTLYNQK